MPGVPISESRAVLCLFCIFLVPLAISGIALVNAGLGRSHSAAHALLTSMCLFAVATGVYFVCGFAWQGFLGGPSRHRLRSGRQWRWLGDEPWFQRGINLYDSSSSLALLLQLFAVGLVAMIPLGASLERWRLSASCASTVLLAGWIYPLFVHWAWAGGWLAQLGVSSNMGHGFLDAGGSGTIHVVGGLTALSVSWILGPRTGKYSDEEIPSAIPGHNTVLVLSGCFLALVGWLGLNAAGAILFTGAPTQRIVLVAVNTTLTAGAALLTTVIITGIRFTRPDVSISANGWVGGLVAGSAAAPFVAPAAAVFIGLVAGALVTYSVEWLELRLMVDDPGGAISVHAVSGIWGLLALGIFASFHDPVLNVTDGAGGFSAALATGNSGQWLAQLVGIATLIGFILPLSYGLNLVLNRFVPFRVHTEGERQGLDLYELGGGAYPEFVTHTEDFTQFHKRKT